MNFWILVFISAMMDDLNHKRNQLFSIYYGTGRYLKVIKSRQLNPTWSSISPIHILLSSHRYCKNHPYMRVRPTQNAHLPSLPIATHFRILLSSIFTTEGEKTPCLPERHMHALPYGEGILHQLRWFGSKRVSMRTPLLPEPKPPLVLCMCYWLLDAGALMNIRAALSEATWY
jgi:hypothetical protein